jgi:hypothetical protein
LPRTERQDLPERARAAAILLVRRAGPSSVVGRRTVVAGSVEVRGNRDCRDERAATADPGTDRNRSLVPRAYRTIFRAVFREYRHRRGGGNVRASTPRRGERDIPSLFRVCPSSKVNRPNPLQLLSRLREPKKFVCGFALQPAKQFPMSYANAEVASRESIDREPGRGCRRRRLVVALLSLVGCRASIRVPHWVGHFKLRSRGVKK